MLARGKCALVCYTCVCVGVFVCVCACVRKCLHKQLKALTDTILSLLCSPSPHRPHEAEPLKQGGRWVSGVTVGP